MPNEWDLVGIPQPRDNVPTKQQIREALRQKMMPHLDELCEALIAKAKGVKHLVGRDPKTKEFVKITPEQIAGGEFEAIEVWQRDPDDKTLTLIMHYSMDKPKEQEQDVAVKGKVEFSWKTDE